MKLFIDTANVEEIRELAWLVDGVTTNPSLVAKEKRPFRAVIEEICGIVDGPISAEVIALDTNGMIEEARELAKIHENVVIKIPMTEPGMKAVRRLTDEGIRTNVTLVFSANQALLSRSRMMTLYQSFIQFAQMANHQLPIAETLQSFTLILKQEWPELDVMPVYPALRE